MPGLMRFSRTSPPRPACTPADLRGSAGQVLIPVADAPKATESLPQIGSRAPAHLAICLDAPTARVHAKCPRECRALQAWPVHRPRSRGRSAHPGCADTRDSRSRSRHNGPDDTPSCKSSSSAALAKRIDHTGDSDICAPLPYLMTRMLATASPRWLRCSDQN